MSSWQQKARKRRLGTGNVIGVFPQSWGEYNDYGGGDPNSFRPYASRRAFVGVKAGVSAAASATETMVRKRARETGSASGATKRVYAKKRSRIGRERPTIPTLCRWTIQRLQGLRQEIPDRDPDNPSTGSGYPGLFAIGKGISAGDGSQLSMPLYIADLTRYANVAGGVSNQCLSQLAIGDVGNPFFVERPTQTASGALGSNAQWRTEKQPFFFSGNGYKLQHMWYDIRLKLYGARKQPVTYDVMLVQFKENYLIPDYTFPNAGAGADPVLDLKNRSQFWQQISRAQIVNTLLPGTSGWKNNLKILRSYRVNLTASLSNDLDRVPENVDLRWFVRDTRILKYHQNTVAFTTDTAVDNVGWNVESITEVQNDPASFKTRTFLIIRATDMTATLPGTSGATLDDMDDTPSFDMVIRRKSRIFSPS